MGQAGWRSSGSRRSPLRVREASGGGFVRVLDAAIRKVAPVWAMKRVKARWSLAASDGFLASSRSYHDAGGGRLNRSRTAAGGSGDDHLDSLTLWKLRERCRDLDRNNTLAMGLLQTDVDNVVSAGHTPQALTGDEGWNEAAEGYWAGTRHDIRGVLGNVEFERLAYYTARRDGDVAFLKVGGQLQAVEGDRIVTPSSLKGHGTVVNGVELDGVGRPVAYHIARGNPSSSYAINTERRDADEVIFVGRPRRFSSTRTEPILTPVIDEIDRLGDYVEATVIAAQMAACFGIWRKSSHWPAKRGSTEANADTGADEQVEEFEPGMQLYLNADEEIGQINPTHPSQSFDKLVDTLCRFCGRHMGFPLELVLLNFSHSNFSNTRAALLQAYRTFEASQAWWQQEFYQPAWDYRIGWAMDEGLLPRNEESGRVTWQSPGWPWVDPKKDAEADDFAIKANLATMRDLCAKRGRFWRDVLKQRKIELDEMKNLGLTDTGGDSDVAPQKP